MGRPCGCSGDTCPTPTPTTPTGSVPECFQPGFANCEPWSGNLAPCEIDKIKRQKGRYTVKLPLEFLGDDQIAALELDPGRSWWAAKIDPVEVAGLVALRNPKITGVSDPGQELGLSKVCLYADPDGTYSERVDWVQFADLSEITTTDGRCGTCDVLIDCQAATKPALVFVSGEKVVAPPPTPTISMQIRRFERSGESWSPNDPTRGQVRDERCCGCPPPLHCGRPLWSALEADMDADKAGEGEGEGMGGGGG